MVAITEDYVSFETAKLLKEKGFDEATHQFYKAITYLGTEANSICIKSLDGIEDEPFHNSVYGVDLNGEDTGEYACPTLQMAMKWLREFHALNIYARGVWKDVEVQYGDWEPAVVGYEWIVESLTDDTYSKMSTEQFLTYEEACEAAIKYCLENLVSYDTGRSNKNH